MPKWTGFEWRQFLGILLFSVIEVIGLVGWLVLVDRGQFILGVAFLAIGLVTEHVVTDNLLHGRSLFRLTGLPLAEIAAFSALETVIWAAWLTLWNTDVVLATVFLAVTLLIEHTISKNVHERRELLDKIVNIAVVPHTIVETAACTGWLLLARSAHPVLGAAVLLVGSIVEHTIAVRGTQPREQ